MGLRHRLGAATLLCASLVGASSLAAPSAMAEGPLDGLLRGLTGGSVGETTSTVTETLSSTLAGLVGEDAPRVELDLDESISVGLHLPEEATGLLGADVGLGVSPEAGVGVSAAVETAGDLATVDVDVSALTPGSIVTTDIDAIVEAGGQPIGLSAGLAAATDGLDLQAELPLGALEASLDQGGLDLGAELPLIDLDTSLDGGGLDLGLDLGGDDIDLGIDLGVDPDEGVDLDITLPELPGLPEIVPEPVIPETVIPPVLPSTSDTPSDGRSTVTGGGAEIPLAPAVGIEIDAPRVPIATPDTAPAHDLHVSSAHADGVTGPVAGLRAELLGEAVPAPVTPVDSTGTRAPQPLRRVLDLVGSFSLDGTSIGSGNGDHHSQGVALALFALLGATLLMSPRVREEIRLMSYTHQTLVPPG